MLQRHVFAAALLAVAATAGCGSSDDAADDPNQDDSGQETEQNSGDADQDDSDDGSSGDDGSGDNDEQEGEPADATPPSVGTFVEGRAVATVSGTPDEPDEQSGDVKRIGQDCVGAESMSGLAAGASVTILDESTGEAVGEGEIESTSAVEISDGADGSPPVWECSFNITGTLSRAAESIRVQVGDFEPWDVEGSFDDFLTTVPISGDSSVETTDTEPTEPSVDTSPPPGTTPPTEPFVTTPST